MKMEHDEIDLMRYVDGEMDAVERAAFEGLMAGDEALRQSVEREQALRQLLQGTYAPVVDEPVPDRLMEALASKRAEAPAVVSLDAERARRRFVPSWAALGGMAASVMLGLVIGYRLLVPSASDVEGNVMAQGELAQLLDTKLAGEKIGEVTAGLSFAAKGGGYCRSFASADAAGIACHESAGWRIRELVPLGSKPGASPEYRTAATNLPPALLQAVDAMREGDVLDARQEAEAKAKGWR
ncbi:anti-sigma factor family protein [Burkholderiaceae bacterium UC74_6]